MPSASRALMGRTFRLIAQPVTYRGALLTLALAICGAFALICMVSEALWMLFRVPWYWPAIRSGLMVGLVLGGPNLLYGVRKRRSRRPST
jgi:hypothetical protein